MKAKLFLAALLILLPAIALGVGGNVTATTRTAPAATPLSQLVGDIYNFALTIGGLLAFVMMVWGAAKYTLNAGNPSQQSDAKQYIWNALLGLGLLLSAYLILNTINPEITNLNLPALKEIKTPVSLPPPSTSCNPPCTGGQVCVRQGNTAICRTPTQPTGCDPMKSYPDNGCTAARPRCVLNINTNQRNCVANP